MTVPITIAVLVVLLGLCAFGSWRLAQPADPLNPRLAPWRTILVFAGFAALVSLIHLLHLFGIAGAAPYR